MQGFTSGRRIATGLSTLSHLLRRQAATQRKKRRRCSRPQPGRKHLFQSLEVRRVLDAVSWIDGSGNWDVAANWLDATTDTNRVPGSGDTVTIDTGTTAATITIKTGDSESIGSLTTTTNDTLSFAGGSLTVGSDSSMLSGPLQMSGGSLTASGASASLTANGATTISNASLYANAELADAHQLQRRNRLR